MAGGNSNSNRAVVFPGANFNMFISTDANVLASGGTSVGIGLLATGTVEFANHGSVYGTSIAIRSSSRDAGSDFNLINTGSISSTGNGLWIEGQTGPVTINNTGSIIGSGIGVLSFTGVNDIHTTTLQNTGTIQGMGFLQRKGWYRINFQYR